MALVLTHPDYMRSSERLDAYEQLLARFAHDDSAWRALPCEVAEWWRRRAGSHVVGDEATGFGVAGAAADDADVTLLG